MTPDGATGQLDVENLTPPRTLVTFVVPLVATMPTPTLMATRTATVSMSGLAVTESADPAFNGGARRTGALNTGARRPTIAPDRGSGSPMCEVGGEGSRSSNGPLRYDPLVTRTTDICDASVVAVVVKDDEPGVFRSSRDDEVGDWDSVLAATGESVLKVDRGRHDFWGDRCRVQGTTLFQNSLVIDETTGAIKYFEIHDGTGGDQPIVHEGPQPRRYRR
jgi:hypothetical protein